MGAPQGRASGGRVAPVTSLAVAWSARAQMKAAARQAGYLTLPSGTAPAGASRRPSQVAAGNTRLAPRLGPARDGLAGLPQGRGSLTRQRRPKSAPARSGLFCAACRTDHAILDEAPIRRFEIVRAKTMCPFIAECDREGALAGPGLAMWIEVDVTAGYKTACASGIIAPGSR